MKKLLILFLIIVLLTPLFTDAVVRVKGYFRKDGTYVQPHYRSDPDSNPFNNWSYPGNINPYTGKVAPGNPDTYLKNYPNTIISPSPLISVPTPLPSISQEEKIKQLQEQIVNILNQILTLQKQLLLLKSGN